MDEHMQTMNIEERKIVAEPIKVLEDVPLDKSNPEKLTRIGTGMGEKMKQDLVAFLRNSMDVFTWSHEDMPKIDPSELPTRVKSTRETQHLDNLRETFDTLKRYKMKLNPSKCAFKVASGKFLGFMVSQRGIEANPDKIQAILIMESPKNIKDIQSLTR
nr:uncharacterized protein LOC112001807 [Quercus suber]